MDMTAGQDVGSIDADEIARFDKVAGTWWDPNGPFKPLHGLNPLRLRYIRDALFRFGVVTDRVDSGNLQPLKGCSILDVGCGGGLLCEPMARLGADVTGIDASAEAISAAGAHAVLSRLDITYRQAPVEVLMAEALRYDVILNMEVIEHVADVPGFLADCARLLKPGGLMLFSTINRTPTSYAKAIVAAEYVLGWVPRGTHDWRKFLTPKELSTALKKVGFSVLDTSGMEYTPLADRWSLGSDLSVNYIGAAKLNTP